MDITLIRHGQPNWEPDGRAVDHPELTNLGHRQAELCAEALRGEHYDHLYVSPLLRAQQTAEPIARALGLEAEVRESLAELRLPSLEGSTQDEVQAFFAKSRLRELEQWWNGFEGGESFRHFYERISGGIESLLVGDHALAVHAQDAFRIWQVPDDDLRIAIVAHEGTNAVIVSHLLGIEPTPWAALRFGSAWTGISRLHASEVGGGFIWALERFNDTAHLAKLEQERDSRPAKRAAGAGFLPNVGGDATADPTTAAPPPDAAG